MPRIAPVHVCCCFVGVAVLILSISSAAAAEDFRIASTDHWTTTSGSVQAGHCYEITATGKWCGSDGQQCGPRGVCEKESYGTMGSPHDMSKEQRELNFVGQHPRDALIGRFNTQQWSFLVGDHVLFIAPESGMMQFRIADDEKTSTKRSGTVTLKLAEAKPHWLDKNGTAVVTARIDARDFLHITPKGIFWQYGGEWQKVGLAEGHYPTVINGIDWWPAWETDTKTALMPATDLWPGEAGSFKLVSVDARRGGVFIDSALADEILLRFEDHGLGSSIVGCTIGLPTSGHSKRTSPTEAAGDEPSDYPVPCMATPVGSAPATSPADPLAIERPEYRNYPKPLLKSLTSITSMMVNVSDDGDAHGVTSDIIATVPAESRQSDQAGIGFAEWMGMTRCVSHSRKPCGQLPFATPSGNPATSI